MVERSLGDLRIHPESWIAHQSLGRVKRLYGIAGWQAHLITSATSQLEQQTAWIAHLHAANMFRLVGQKSEQVANARRAVELIQVSDSPGAINPEVGNRCNALVLAEDRTELVSVADRFGQPQVGPKWWPILTAARVVEHADVETLAREVEAAERLAEAEDVNVGGFSMNDRDLAEVLRKWLNDLD